MTIHSTHPFADPAPDLARRLRGRLGGAVSLWTAGKGLDRAGLTVSSVLVATGDPAAVVGLLDPDSELADQLLGTGRGVVALLPWRHRDLADVFAGVAPAPGGRFAQAEFTDTAWGPRLVDVDSWVGISVAETLEVGWSLLVTGVVDHLELGKDPVATGDGLEHRRGRYLRRGE